MRILIDESVTIAANGAKRQGWIKASNTLFIDHENEFVKIVDIIKLNKETNVEFIYVGQMFWESGQAACSLLNLYCEKHNIEIKGL